MNCYDPGTKLAFNPNRADSTMTVVHEDSPTPSRRAEGPDRRHGAHLCRRREDAQGVRVLRRRREADAGSASAVSPTIGAKGEAATT